MSNRISLSINNNNLTERNSVGNSYDNNHVKDTKPRKPRSLKFWFFSFFPFYILTPLLPFLFTQAIWIAVIIVLSGFLMTLFYKGGESSSKPGTKELSSSGGSIKCHIWNYRWTRNCYCNWCIFGQYTKAGC